MQKPSYSEIDRFEFNYPTSWHEEQLRTALMEIWLNRNFIMGDDLKKLQYMTTKGLFKTTSKGLIETK